MVKRNSLRQVPWQSWEHWMWVADGIFSDDNDRITAAQNRIKAWHSRGNVPISVETTAALTSIHQRDPRFNNELPSGGGLPDDMLRMMYAMSIQRLVNGVVDVSAKRNASSVASRADSAGLPRLLVDIRHETAHNELPGLPLLQSASKQALEWLKVHYWDQQRQVLGNAREQIKKKLLAHCQLVLDILTPISKPKDDGIDENGDGDDKQQRLVKVMRAMRNIHKHNLVTMKQERHKVFHELVELCLSSTSELVSILVDEGLLEQEVLPGPEGRDHSQAESDDVSTTGSFDLGAATYTAWRYTICKLSSKLPRLPAMLLVAIVKRIGSSRPITGQSMESMGERAGANSTSIPPTRCLMAPSLTGLPADSPKEIEGGLQISTGFKRLTAWCAWLLASEDTEAPDDAISQDAVKSKALGITRHLSVKAELNEELCRELLRSCLYLSSERGPQVELVSLIAMKVGSKKLQQRALMLANYGSTTPRVSDVNHKANDDMETDSVSAPRAETEYLKEAATPVRPAGGETLEGSTPSPDQSEQPVRATTTSDIDDSNFQRMKKQQLEFLSRVSSKSNAASRLVVRAEDDEKIDKLRIGCNDDQKKSYAPSTLPQGQKERRWTLAENWRPCALGMIPSPYHAIGTLPSLELRQTAEANNIMCGEVQAEGRENRSNHQEQEVTVQDTAMARVVDNVTKISLQTSLTKRKSDGEPGSPAGEKSAKKSGRHVHFSVADDETRESNQSSVVKKPMASKIQGRRLSGGSLLEGCLRQNGYLMHVSSQQLEALKAAVHVL